MAHQDEFDFDAVANDPSGPSPFKDISRPSPPPQQELEWEAGNSDESGFQQWREELDSNKRAFEKKHGIALNTEVRVQLSFMAKEINGHLTMQREADGTASLKIGSLSFTPTEIVSFSKLD